MLRPTLCVLALAAGTHGAPVKRESKEASAKRPAWYAVDEAPVKKHHTHKHRKIHKASAKIHKASAKAKTSAKVR